MPIQDDRTTNFSLKKPYPTNLLADDVLRLREALDIIDAALNARPTSSAVQGQVDAAVNALVAAAPAALNTLDELAAALNDDASFATTVTNLISAAQATANAALPKAGGTMTGDIAMGSNRITGAADPVAATDVATKQYADGAGSKGYAYFCGSF